MIIHPATLIFMFMLSLSIMIMISSDSLFMSWLSLEINLISFMPILVQKTKYSSESSMKYMLTQAISSSIIMISLLIFKNTEYLTMIVLTALAMKISAAPFHSWFTSMSEGCNYTNLLMIMTLQKINPFIMMMLMLQNNKFMNFISLMVIMSATVGSLGGINQMSIRKLLCFSSISHTAWMMSSMTKFSNWFIYFMIYSFMNMNLMILLKKMQMFYISQLTKKNWLIMINILSLAGLPPLLGFFPKIMLMNNLLKETALITVTMLLVSTLISLFFYLRLSIMLNFKNYKTNLHMTHSTKSLYIMNMFNIFLPVLLIFT